MAKVKFNFEFDGGEVLTDLLQSIPAPSNASKSAPSSSDDLSDLVGELIDKRGDKVMCVTDLLHSLVDIRARIEHYEEIDELKSVLNDAVMSMLPWRRNVELAERLRELAIVLPIAADQQIMLTAAGYFCRRDGVADDSIRRPRGMH